jgi:hypothetical protein
LGRRGEDFFAFFFVPIMFPICSHEVPKGFPKFPNRSQ